MTGPDVDLNDRRIGAAMVVRGRVVHDRQPLVVLGRREDDDRPTVLDHDRRRAGRRMSDRRCDPVAVAVAVGGERIHGERLILAGWQCVVGHEDHSPDGSLRVCAGEAGTGSGTKSNARRPVDKRGKVGTIGLEGAVGADRLALSGRNFGATNVERHVTPADFRKPLVFRLAGADMARCASSSGAAGSRLASLPGR